MLEHKAKIPICSWGTSCAEKWMSKLALDAQGSHSRSRKRCFKPLVPLHRCQGMRDWKPFNPTRVAPSCTGTNHRVCQLGSSGSARSAPSPLRINLNQKRCIMKRQTIRLQVRNSHSTGQPCPASTCRPLPHVCFRYAENLPLTSEAKAALMRGAQEIVRDGEVAFVPDADLLIADIVTDGLLVSAWQALEAASAAQTTPAARKELKRALPILVGFAVGALQHVPDDEHHPYPDTVGIRLQARAAAVQARMTGIREKAHK